MAKYLGVSETTVRNLDGTLLHPTVNAAGVFEYELSDVKEAKRLFYLRKYNRKRVNKRRHLDKLGRKAARAMALFRLDTPLDEVVEELEVTPNQARAWFEDFRQGYEKKPQNPLPVRIKTEPIEPPKEIKNLPPIAPVSEEHENSLAEALKKLGI